MTQVDQKRLLETADSSGREPPIKVVYIGGYSRSGSTLVDRMLGQIPGVVSTGELAYIWTHGLKQNRLCGCGARFFDCPFWSSVGREAFGGWDAVDADEMLELERRVNRHRFVPFLLRPQVRPEFEQDLREYAQVLAGLFRAIHVVGGSRIIVDSTIDPAYGFLLRHVPDLDLRLVHLVRDSRGTSHSWTRKVRRSDRIDEVVYMRRFHPALTALRWTLYHSLITVLEHVGEPACIIRYEDVVASPREQVQRIAEAVDLPLDAARDLDFIGDGEVQLGTNHTVAGNRMRLYRGTLPLRVDDDWRRDLSSGHQRAVTLASWPLLRQYGYLQPEGGRAA
jgi:hypothetical protein